MAMVQELTGDERLSDFADLQNALLGSESIQQFLHGVAVLAARLVTSDLSCGMTVGPRGRAVTVACSEPEAAQVDEVQYELDDGPCLHAMRDGSLVRIDDTADQQGRSGTRTPQLSAADASPRQGRDGAAGGVVCRPGPVGPR